MNILNNFEGAYFKYYEFFGKQYVRPFAVSSGVYNSEKISGYTPDMLKSAYEFDGEFSGEGITIGIAEAFGSPTIENDINIFSRQFGLPDVNIETETADYGGINYNDNWIIETSLDCQWVHAFAPRAKIVLAVSSSEEFSDMMNAVARAAEKSDIVVMSWGSHEFAGQQMYEDMFSRNDACYIASSGDVGGVTFYPSNSKFVTSVGGTSLFINGNGEIIGQQKAWKYSGGGTGRYISIPEYQRINSDVQRMCGQYRGTPDIAFFADTSPGVAVYHSYPINSKSGWTTGGGTSLGAPCVAGIAACIAQKNKDVLKNFNTYLYAAAGRTKYVMPQRNFYDVVLGTNGVYSAKPGYDFCTGLGTPNIKNLIELAK